MSYYKQAGLMVLSIFITTAVSAAPVLFTNIESDSTAQGFPPGVDQEWTRFGIHYNGIETTSTSAIGANTLWTAADWGAEGPTWGYGVRYNPAGASVDISTGPVISFIAKSEGTGSVTTHFFYEETDGDQWVTPDFTLTNTYKKYIIPLASSTNVDATGGADRDYIVSLIGFDFLRAGQTSGTPGIYIDEIYWNEELPPVANLVTNVETDTSTGGFPPGVAGEWTRFGVPYNGLIIDMDAADAAAGSNSVFTAADWSAGSWGYGIRYNVDPVIDMSSNPSISFMAKFDGVGVGTVALAYQETDGDIWSCPPVTLTTSYEKYICQLAGSILEDAAGGGDRDYLINQIGFNMLRGTQTAGTPVFHFDEIYWNVVTGPAQPPVLPLVTSMNPPDFTTAGFPDGTTGEWTRFGAAYGGLAIVSSPADASEGSNYLQVIADWVSGLIVGVRHMPYPSTSDWTGYKTISFDVKANTALAGTTVEFALFESDGDIFVSPAVPVTTAYETKSFAFSDLVFDAGSTGGDGALNPAAISLYGLNFRNLGFSGSQIFSVDNLRLSGPASVSDWAIY